MLLDTRPASDPERAEPPARAAFHAHHDSARDALDAASAAVSVAPARQRTPLPAPATPAGRNRRGPARLLLGVLVALLIAIQLGALDGNPAPAPASHPAATASATPAATPTAQPASLRTAAAERTRNAFTAAGLDALSPELAEYAASQGANMGVVVYDLTHNRLYGANGDGSFTLASSAKVYILCAYLDMVEHQGRRPNSAEVAQMTAMITRSDNNAAQWLYNRIGQAAGQARYLAQLGITGYVGHGYDWGWAQLSPAAMVHILTMLQLGQILSPADRALALGLMGHVSLGRWGVGDTAPRGAQIFMKDGWVTGPDGRWAQNSSGIVVTEDGTYVISVYTQHQPRYDWSKVQHVCATVAALLA